MGRAVTRRDTPIHAPQWLKIQREIRKDKKLHRDLTMWIKTMWVPAWDHTGANLKMLSWAVALHQDGAKTLNLNLGPEVSAVSTFETD